MSVGTILRGLRGNRSQKEISDAVGVTKSAWAMYERDERVPRDEIKVKIADYFGVPVQDIFFARYEH